MDTPANGTENGSTEPTYDARKTRKTPEGKLKNVKDKKKREFLKNKVVATTGGTISVRTVSIKKQIPRIMKCKCQLC